MKKCSSLLFLLLFANLVFAQQQDSLADARKVHKKTGSALESKFSEYGFFQKVHSDAGGPRFMVADEKDNFRFGIGGTVHATVIHDFSGSVDGLTFTTWNIPVPTDFAGQTGFSMGASKLNFKAIGKLGKRDVVAFVEIGVGSSGNGVNLRHAYFSYGGLTVGQTYSFFMDMAAGPMTVDLEGPNTQVNKRHPLVGYTFNIKDKWKIAASIERQELGSVQNPSLGIYDEFQEIPDIATRASFSFKNGHVQLATLLRYLYYYAEDTLNRVTRSGSISNLGMGLSLSGSWRFAPSTSFSFQSVAGHGIASYIQDLSNSRLDLITMLNPDSKYELRTSPMYGGYFAIQHHWSPSVLSSLVYGYVHLYRLDGYTYNSSDCDDFRASHYFAMNVFWNVNDYFVLGAEYLFGQRENMTPDGSTAFGSANRVDVMLSYSF